MSWLGDNDYFLTNSPGFNELQEERLNDYIRRHMWIDKDRKEHKISEMPDKYIENCIKFCMNRPERNGYIEIFRKELKKRKINNK